MSERCVPMIEVEGEPCEEHGWPMAGFAYGGLCIEGRLIKAEAAIKRVREVCAEASFWAEGGPYSELVRAVTVLDVFEALNGDSDE